MKMTNFRWVVCGMLFFATCINYMDRQVLSLTWKDFLSPEFGWTEEHYGYITAIFSLSYALFMFFAGKVMDMMGARWGYVLAVTLWSFGAILHAFCGIVTCGLLTGHWLFSFDGSRELLHDYNVATLAITTCSMYLFLVCRLIFSLGISANFPVAIKVTTEYFPKKDRACATAIFNSGACVGALIAPITIPYLANRFGSQIKRMKCVILAGGSGDALWPLSRKNYPKQFINIREGRSLFPVRGDADREYGLL